MNAQAVFPAIFSRHFVGPKPQPRRSLSCPAPTHIDSTPVTWRFSPSISVAHIAMQGDQGIMQASNCGRVAIIYHLHTGGPWEAWKLRLACIERHLGLRFNVAILKVHQLRRHSALYFLHQQRGRLWFHSRRLPCVGLAT